MNEEDTIKLKAYLKRLPYFQFVPKTEEEKNMRDTEIMVHGQKLILGLGIHYVYPKKWRFRHSSGNFATTNYVYKNVYVEPMLDPGFGTSLPICKFKRDSSVFEIFQPEQAINKYQDMLISENEEADEGDRGAHFYYFRVVFTLNNNETRIMLPDGEHSITYDKIYVGNIETDVLPEQITTIQVEMSMGGNEETHFILNERFLARDNWRQTRDENTVEWKGVEYNKKNKRFHIDCILNNGDRRFILEQFRDLVYPESRTLTDTGADYLMPLEFMEHYAKILNTIILTMMSLLSPQDTKSKYVSVKYGDSWVSLQYNPFPGSRAIATSFTEGLEVQMPRLLGYDIISKIGNRINDLKEKDLQDLSVKDMEELSMLLNQYKSAQQLYALGCDICQRNKATHILDNTHFVCLKCT